LNLESLDGWAWSWDTPESKGSIDDWDFGVVLGKKNKSYGISRNSSRTLNLICLFLTKAITRNKEIMEIVRLLSSDNSAFFA
jgi:hypothetical protein